MEQQTEEFEILDLIPRPTFGVRAGVISRLNPPAKKLFLREGLSLSPLLESGSADYAAFSDGMLYLTLVIHGQRFGASVVRVKDEDIFTLDQQFDNDELRVLALAARELRGPLAGAMLAARKLSDQDAAQMLNRSLYQLLRIIGNMSDASGVSPTFRPENQNVCAVFREIAEKAIQLSDTTGIPISYTGPEEELVCCLDRQLMERAVLNMISNALKFTPAGGTIRLALRQNGKQFRFSITDDGCGMSRQEQATLFSRYLREPTIEDTRHGIGLGMLLIRNTAAQHLGAVLVDNPQGCGTRVTMTFSSVPTKGKELHTRAMIADYAGEQDHALIELSEFLPPRFY